MAIPSSSTASPPQPVNDARQLVEDGAPSSLGARSVTVDDPRDRGAICGFAATDSAWALGDAPGWLSSTSARRWGAHNDEVVYGGWLLGMDAECRSQLRAGPGVILTGHGTRGAIGCTKALEGRLGEPFVMRPGETGKVPRVRPGHPSPPTPRFAAEDPGHPGPRS